MNKTAHDYEVHAGPLPYEAPVLVRQGSLDELTKGLADGEDTDKTFPVNTPKKFLTFS